MIDLKNPARDYGDEYAFWEDVEYITPKIEHNIRPKGYQWKTSKTRSACTIIWAVNQLIRLFWLDLITEQTNILYDEVVDYCTKFWYVIGSWRSTPTACNAVCKRRNEAWYKKFWKEKVFWLRLYWSDKKLVEALDEWHLVWFSKHVNYWKHQVEWLVYWEPSLYPEMVWHRLNWKWIQYTVPTWWADITWAERGAQDNYHWAIWENFAFKSIKPYINHWMYAYWYVILPVSCMKENIEKEKEKIAKKKAYNVLISIMSSTYKDVDEEFQMMSWSYATALRDKTNERPVEKDEVKKAYQAVCDVLSYEWKHAWEEEQKMFSELASYLRKKYDLK